MKVPAVPQGQNSAVTRWLRRGGPAAWEGRLLRTEAGRRAGRGTGASCGPRVIGARRESGARFSGLPARGRRSGWGPRSPAAWASAPGRAGCSGRPGARAGVDDAVHDPAGAHHVHHEHAHDQAGEGARPLPTWRRRRARPGRLSDAGTARRAPLPDARRRRSRESRRAPPPPPGNERAARRGPPAAPHAAAAAAAAALEPLDSPPRCFRASHRPPEVARRVAPGKRVVPPVRARACVGGAV